MMHAYQMGPCADLNRARTGRHGRLRVEADGRRLRFVGNDGKQVSLSVDDPVELCAMILEASNPEWGSSVAVALDMLCKQVAANAQGILGDG